MIQLNGYSIHQESGFENGPVGIKSMRLEQPVDPVATSEFTVVGRAPGTQRLASRPGHAICLLSAKTLLPQL